MIVHLSRIAILVAATTALSAESTQGPPAVATPLLTQALPDLKGKEVAMVTVEYPPGGESNPHRHNANTFVYVLEGSVVMQVQGGPELTLRPGDTFYESPTDIHVVSRNASDTQSAKFLVLFVKDQGASTMAPAAAK